MATLKQDKSKADKMADHMAQAMATSKKQEKRTKVDDIPCQHAYTLLLPNATPSNNTIKGLHYKVYQKLRQQWREDILKTKTLPFDFKAIKKSYIEIDRYSSGGGLDWDNAFGGLKPMFDCLVRASQRNPDGLGLIEDDNPRSMPIPPRMTQLPAPPGSGFTIVRVYSLETPENGTT